jgi:hypothetical protein
VDFTDTDILALGAYCEAIMRDAHFNTLVRISELSAFEAFKHTATADTAGRERAYSELTGLQNFLALMLSLVEQRENLLEEMTFTPSSDDDA